VGSTVYAVLRGQEEREECLTAGMQRALGERHEQGLETLLVIINVDFAVTAFSLSEVSVLP